MKGTISCTSRKSDCTGQLFSPKSSVQNVPILKMAVTIFQNGRYLQYCITACRQGLWLSICPISYKDCVMLNKKKFQYYQQLYNDLHCNSIATDIPKQHLTVKLNCSIKLTMRPDKFSFNFRNGRKSCKVGSIVSFNYVFKFRMYSYTYLGLDFDRSYNFVNRKSNIVHNFVFFHKFKDSKNICFILINTVLRNEIKICTVVSNMSSLLTLPLEA